MLTHRTSPPRTRIPSPLLSATRYMHARVPSEERPSSLVAAVGRALPDHSFPWSHTRPAGSACALRRISPSRERACWPTALAPRAHGSPGHCSRRPGTRMLTSHLKHCPRASGCYRAGPSGPLFPLGRTYDSPALPVCSGASLSPSRERTRRPTALALRRRTHGSPCHRIGRTRTARHTRRRTGSTARSVAPSTPPSATRLYPAHYSSHRLNCNVTA